jgi:hypothetical protein
MRAAVFPRVQHAVAGAPQHHARIEQVDGQRGAGVDLVR